MDVGTFLHRSFDNRNTGAPAIQQLARKFCLSIFNFNKLEKVLVATVVHVPRVEPELGEGGSLQPPLCDVE